ncbi:MAG: hypothetical protein JNJ61_30960 [Anaerolineae bacterium]|nr:hypothetical protein [Anaerolineae bacterium]
MTNMETLFRTIDELSPKELNDLFTYVQQRLKKVAWWGISPQKLARIDALMGPIQEEAAQMTDDDINAVIDEAIAEARREHKQSQSRD